MTMPKTVPVLKAEDFVIGPYDCGDRLCLIAWRHRFFGNEFENKRADKVMDQCCDDVGERGLYGGQPDSPRNKNKAAQIWSKFIDRMGYTEDGPEMELQ